MRNKLILILALVFSLVAAFLTFSYTEHLKKIYRASGNYAPVVVAEKRIPPRTVITPQMLKLMEVPVEYINNRAVVDTKDAIGKVTKSEMFPGEQVLMDKLLGPKDQDDGLALKVSEGKRAVAIPIDDVSGLAGMLRPGDKIDVLTTFELQSQSTEKSVMTSTIIQDVVILALGQQTDSQGAEKKIKTQSTATLMVTPEQAQQLVLASERGSIRLLLRSPGDRGINNLPSAKMENLVR